MTGEFKFRESSPDEALLDETPNRADTPNPKKNRDSKGAATPNQMLATIR